MHGLSPVNFCSGQSPPVYLKNDWQDLPKYKWIILFVIKKNKISYIEWAKIMYREEFSEAGEVGLSSKEKMKTWGSVTTAMDYEF